MVICALRGSLFGWGGRGILTQALSPLIGHRVGVILATVERMLVRFLAGKDMRRAPRVEVVGSDAVVGVRVWGRSFWPREFGWLTDLMKHHATVYTCQLEALLGEPEMVGLLRASPQAVKLLRPVCRMLAVRPEVLRPLLPGEVLAVVAPREKARRVRAKVPPVDWGRVPLPRGVLSWARRERRLERFYSGG